MIVIISNNVEYIVNAHHSGLLSIMYMIKCHITSVSSRTRTSNFFLLSSSELAPMDQVNANKKMH